MATRARTLRDEAAVWEARCTEWQNANDALKLEKEAAGGRVAALEKKVTKLEEEAQSFKETLTKALETQAASLGEKLKGVEDRVAKVEERVVESKDAVLDLGAQFNFAVEGRLGEEVQKFLTSVDGKPVHGQLALRWLEKTEEGDLYLTRETLAAFDEGQRDVRRQLLRKDPNFDVAWLGIPDTPPQSPVVKVEGEEGEVTPEAALSPTAATQVAVPPSEGPPATS